MDWAKKGMRCIILILILPWVFSGCGPKLSAVAYDEINAESEPVQTPCDPGRNALNPLKGGELKIVPMAVYQIAAVVKGKKRYYFDQGAPVAPFDLVLAWGKLADPEMDRYISYSQTGRWYYFTYKADCPVNGEYIVSHSANNHVIPADDNVYQAIRSIRVGEPVVLEGFLVNVEGIVRGYSFRWCSSLSRNDSGNGACELFYVQKVRIGRLIYQ